jgi:anaerobic selenocysteine-containing dehydrogenase
VPDAAHTDPDDDRFLVVTPKTHHFLNSSFVDHDRLRRMAGAPSALLAPVDAARLAVADGDVVHVESDHGAVAVTAAVSDDVLAGTVVIPSNWWHRDFTGGLGANALTGQDLTDLGTGPQFAVRAYVRPAHESDPPMGRYPRIEPSERT